MLAERGNIYCIQFPGQDSIESECTEYHCQDGEWLYSFGDHCWTEKELREAEVTEVKSLTQRLYELMAMANDPEREVFVLIEVLRLRAGDRGSWDPSMRDFFDGAADSIESSSR